MGRAPAGPPSASVRSSGSADGTALLTRIFLEIVCEFFGNCLKFVWLIFGPPGGPLGPPRGPKMGPGTPGIDLKSPKKIQKFGPEVSTIFENLIFGFLGVL